MNKLIVLDLDGTTLRNDKTVSKYTIETLLKMKETGHKILFATARPPRDAYKYVPETLRDNPIICYNGATIVSSKDLNVIYRKSILKKDVLNIIDIIESFGYTNITMEVNDVMYSNFDTTPFFGNSKNDIRDLKTMEFENADKIIICSKEPIDEKIVMELPKSVKGILTDAKTLCQIINVNASKWTAIKDLSSKLKIETKDIIAFGDDINDLDMIMNAGVGIAMGNAEEKIKNIADFITDTNENDGVAKFLMKGIV